MKSIILTILLGLALTNYAQSTTKTATFVVKGNCEDCKSVIENAADIKGVKLLTWNTKTKIASVTYQSDKTTLETIQKAIADKGYDTELYKGNDKAYKRLPKCCRYRDTACEEPKN